MLSVSVLAGAGTSKASTTTELISSGPLLVGRLALADQQSIFVNGTEARTGTSIFSGMRLQSPDGVNAAVQLGKLGHINLEPSTDLTLEFAEGRVAVTVAAGHATLTTRDGVEGVLTAADGNVMKSVGAKGTVLSSNSAATAAKMSNGRKAAWIIAGVAAVVIIAVVVATDDDDSPTNP
jgi:hypothetical protein